MIRTSLSEILSANIPAGERWRLVDELATRNQAKVRAMMGLPPAEEEVVDYTIAGHSAGPNPYKNGFEVAGAGVGVEANPFRDDTEDILARCSRLQWARGWSEARRP